MLNHEDLLVNDKDFKNMYPLSIRLEHLFNTFIRCGDKNQTYVSKINKIERNKNNREKEEWKKAYDNKIVQLKISEVSNLELDPNIVHPFVKVHFVYKNYGSYL